MKTHLEQSDKDKLSAKSALFLEEFEADFIEYFVALCASYDYSVDKNEAKKMALAIYKNIFKCDFEITELPEELFLKMRENGVMVGFLVNKSIFYVMEKYMEFARRHDFSPHIEMLMVCVNRFIALLENKIAQKSPTCTVSFDTEPKEVVFSTNNTIVELFRTMKNEGKSVTFINLYQGVPITYDAKILSIEGETIEFSMDRLQEIAMKLDGNAFIIKNDYFGKHIKADIVYNNFLTNTVTLHNFIYLLNMPALQREFVRVHPDIVAKVYLHHHGNIQTTGRLYDLSMTGLGVLSHENNGISMGAKVLVAFELNHPTSHSGDEKIEVQAEVMNIIECKGSYRYCMRIFPEKEMNDKIISYIAQREKEILENLSDKLKDYMV